jgi:hypothetical protein
MIDSTVFSTLTPTDFTDAKCQLHNADIMLCQGTGSISQIICSQTNSPFSHVALILQLPITGQWLVLESVESYGVRCVTLEEGYLTNYMGSHRSYDGKILIARHEQAQQQQHFIQDFYHKAFALVGNRYSREDIFKIAARIGANKIGIHESGEIFDGENYICSEFVYACFKAMNIHLPFDPLGFIAPADIARAKEVKPVLALNTHACNEHSITA